MRRRLRECCDELFKILHVMSTHLVTWMLFLVALSLLYVALSVDSDLLEYALVAAGASAAGAAPVVSAIRHNRAASGVTLAPGVRLLGILRFIFPRRAFECIFAQMVEDYREEYFEDLAAGRSARAKWLTCCLYFNLVWSIVFWIGTSIVKKLVDLWKLS